MIACGLFDEVLVHDGEGGQKEYIQQRLMRHRYKIKREENTCWNGMEKKEI